MSRNLKADLRQYGLWRYLGRLIKAGARRCGVNFEMYYYIVIKIDYERQKAFFGTHPLTGVRELSYDDYAGNPQLGYTGRRLQLQKERFDKGTYRAFGVEDNGKLVYACMISLEEFTTSQQWVSGCLDKDEGFMLDAFCAPEARGKGIHGAMNAYRLMKIYESGKKRCGGVVVVDNKPALKSQLKVGYKVAFKYYTLEIGKKHYTNFFKLKEKCK